MLAYDTKSHRYIIDPHYLSIIPLRAIWDADKSKDKEIATSLLMWLYHMYNPHSPFRDHRNTLKSMAIVESCFPKKYVQEKLDLIKADLEKVPENEVKADTEIKLPVYDPALEPGMDVAIQWYQKHLKQTPLWNAYEAYKEAMYNLSKIIRDPTANAQSIRTASNELDTLPVKMDKMRQQAEKDEAMTLKVSGDKTVKRGERLEQERKGKNRSEVKVE